MKCALELLAIAAEKEEERKKEIYLETINYCEELGKELEYLIKISNKMPTVKFYCGELIDGTCLIFTKRDKSRYVGGNPDFNYTGKKINLEVMKEYLDKYCFKMNFKDIKFWSYGMGEWVGYEITIELNSECLKISI